MKVGKNKQEELLQQLENKNKIIEELKNKNRNLSIADKVKQTEGNSDVKLKDRRDGAGNRQMH